MLRPGGVLAYSVWLGDGSASALSYVFDAIAAHGDPRIALPPAPGAHDYAIPEIAEPALRTAGFARRPIPGSTANGTSTRPTRPMTSSRRARCGAARCCAVRDKNHAAAIREAVRRKVLSDHGTTGPWPLPIPSVVVRAEAA